MLDQLKDTQAVALAPSVLKNNTRFFEWVEKTSAEKKEYRMDSEKWSMENYLNPEISAGDLYSYTVKKKNREFCDFLESQTELSNNDGFIELARYFDMRKTFAMRFLGYESVHARILSLLNAEKYPESLQEARKLVLDQYIQLHDEVQKHSIFENDKSRYLFIVKQSTLDFFKTTLDGYRKVLDITGYVYEISPGNEEYHFHFSEMLDNLPFLEIFVVPLENGEYNTLLNFGEWVG